MPAICNPLLPVSLVLTEELRKLSWSGIPKPVRAITWKLLSVSCPLCAPALHPLPRLAQAAHPPAPMSAWGHLAEGQKAYCTRDVLCPVEGAGGRVPGVGRHVL